MPRCEQCGKEGACKRCGKCQAALYCSAECQTIAWKAGHRVKCVKAEAAVTAAAGDAVRSAATAPAGNAVGAHGEECAICLDKLFQPLALPCSHCFCRVCVEGMRKAGCPQVCPLCRGPWKTDTERLYTQAVQISRQIDAWVRRNPTACMTLPVHVQPLVRKGSEMLRAVLQAFRTEEQECQCPQARAELEPAFLLALREYALYCTRSGDTGASIAHYERYLARDPPRNSDTAYVLHCLGNNLRDRDAEGDMDAAERHICDALKITPDDAQAYSKLAQLLAKKGDKAGSIRAYRRATEIDQNFLDAFYNLAMALESDTGLPPTCHFPSPTPPTRAVQEQIQLLTHVTQRNPADLDACLELGKVMARSGHYPGTPHPAAPYFLHVLAREPSYPTAAYELGMLSFHRDEVDNAERLFRREISCNPGHDYAHIYLGRILECHRHDFEGALACYRTGAALDPNEAVGHFYLGDLLCHYFSNADDAAIQAYRRAIAINPGFSNAYQNLGIVLAGLALKGKPEPKVSFDANRSLRMECPFSEEDILEYHRNRDEAIKAFRAAIVHKPDYADAYWRLGVLLAATDDEVGAEAAICKCVELNPQQPNGEVALADLRHRIANPKTEEERTAELLQKAFAGLGTGTGAAAAGRGSGNDREDDEEADSKATAGGTKQKGSKKKKKKKKKK